MQHAPLAVSVAVPYSIAVLSCRSQDGVYAAWCLSLWLRSYARFIPSGIPMQAWGSPLLPGK